MRVIWKYEVPVDDAVHLVPSRPVHVAAKDDVTLLAWCPVDPDDRMREPETVRVFGTGQPIPQGAFHVGTVQAGRLWHLFAGYVSGE